MCLMRIYMWCIVVVRFNSPRCVSGCFVMACNGVLIHDCYVIARCVLLCAVVRVDGGSCLLL